MAAFGNLPSFDMSSDNIISMMTLNDQTRLIKAQISATATVAEAQAEVYKTTMETQKATAQISEVPERIKALVETIKALAAIDLSSYGISQEKIVKDALTKLGLDSYR